MKALGGSYGGNSKPTRFLCLILKMLQIQPEDGIVEQFLENEDFKYVRALGAFYLRLTGRPSEIYELIEPLFNDHRKLRYRTPTGWIITYMDELADELLHQDRYCGIALPHLPKREVLETAGYLDGPRQSSLAPLIEDKAGGSPERMLELMANGGNEAAITALEERKKRKREAEEKEQLDSSQNQQKETRDSGEKYSYYGSTDGGFKKRGDDADDTHRSRRDDEGRSRTKDKDKKSKKKDKYGSLFKKSFKRETETTPVDATSGSAEKDEASAEYWNAERAKLGLKPLKE